MSDIPEDIMNAARKVVVEDLGMDSPGLLQTSYVDCIAEALLEERERSRQLLSEAETREREARVKALEEAATIVDGVSHEGLHNSMWRYRFERVAADIRALQSEER